MPTQTVSLQSLEYSCDGSQHQGFVATRNGNAGGPRPGIVIAHDAWGIGQHVEMRARMLAELGYVVFAVDLYGKGVKPNSLDEARAIIEDLSARPGVLINRALTGLAILAALPNVDKSRLGAVGHCFGGMAVLEMARAGAACGAIASFHGLLKTITRTQPGGIRSKLLVCTGTEDPLVPLEDVTAFQNEMRAAGADCQTIIYTGARHGFANPFSSVHPAIAHHPEADRRSWRAMLDLFDEAFGQVQQ